MIWNKILPFLTRSSVCMRYSTKNLFEGTFDRFNCYHVDFCNSENRAYLRSKNNSQFSGLLKEFLKTLEERRASAIWLKFHIQDSQFLSECSNLGFSFHHAEGDQCLLYRWLKTDLPSKLPRFATHQVGVAGVVFRQDEQKVLAVQDANRTFALWKFPGGLAELGEDISDAATREVKEETGIDADFKGVLMVRQQHDQPGAWGRSDFYFLCFMQPLSYEISPCDHEVEQCAWLTLDELEERTKISALTQTTIGLLRNGSRHGFEQYLWKKSRMKSVYKGLHFSLYHPSL